MCGIVSKLNFDGSAVNNDILEQYDAQKDRGTQGFGLFDGQEMHLIRTASEDKILKWLCRYDSNFILFHHRWPTSTINVARAAHPMSTGKYFGKKQYVMVHNGVIRNADELYVDHQESGIEYRTMLPDLTFNDSEALLWDLALTLEGKQKKLKTEGNMAFVILELENRKLLKMHFGRSTSRPLRMYRDKETLELSSEGRGDNIEINTLYSYNYALKRLTNKPMEFCEWKYNTAMRDDVKSWNRWRDEDDDPYMGDYDSYDEWVMANESRAYSKHILQIGEVLDGRWIQRDDGTWIEQEAPGLSPTIDDVMEAVQDYIIQARGNFNLAYWKAEDDYDRLIEESDTVENVADQILLERVMEAIESDPENINLKSKSSIWEALCQQQKLLEVV
ncbi:MAG TPA: hypothetical protein VGF75_01445 [Candidatus Saccharimonadales bacterium]